MILYRRSKPRQLAVVCLAAFVLALFGCERITERLQQNDGAAQAPQTAPGAPASVHLAIGNPSSAYSSDPDNYLLAGDSYALSYNNSRGTANWVSWRTTISDLGKSIPRPYFRPDPRLPPGFVQVFPSDYSGSGYDRGHLVPSADRFGDIDANEETFFMTNIVPQTGELNQNPWERLESHARGLVRRGHDLYTIAGVYGYQGQLNGKVTVPTNCWKVIVALPRGADPSQLGDDARVIAVDMPNAENVAGDRWQKHLTKVRAIEEKTGYDFFSHLPVDLQDLLETKTYSANR